MEMSELVEKFMSDTQSVALQESGSILQSKDFG